VDLVRRWSEKAEIGAGRFIVWLDIAASKFYDWRERYGKVNEHNGRVPRDFWLEDREKQAIIGFHLKNPLEGYRRLTCTPGGGRRSMPPGIGSWRRRENSGRFAGSRLREERRGPISERSE
jgi:hypothetical protein